MNQGHHTPQKSRARYSKDCHPKSIQLAQARLKVVDEVTRLSRREIIDALKSTYGTQKGYFSWRRELIKTFRIDIAERDFLKQWIAAWQRRQTFKKPNLKIVQDHAANAECFVEIEKKKLRRYLDSVFSDDDSLKTQLTARERVDVLNFVEILVNSALEQIEAFNVGLPLPRHIKAGLRRPFLVLRKEIANERSSLGNFIADELYTEDLQIGISILRNVLIEGGKLTFKESEQIRMINEKVQKRLSNAS